MSSLKSLIAFWALLILANVTDSPWPWLYLGLGVIAGISHWSLERKGR